MSSGRMWRSSVSSMFSLKPGSVDAIQRALDIAQSLPSTPFLLQWTGGRGGGHHSFEDFHQPITQMYSKIRESPNVVLVAGSGFGGASDTLPYLTGEWAIERGLPSMPFDGVLFGSRAMVAKETKLCQAAKEAIVRAPGVDEEGWKKLWTTMPQAARQVV